MLTITLPPSIVIDMNVNDANKITFDAVKRFRDLVLMFDSWSAARLLQDFN